MMGISQQQELDAMPDGMAKRILLKIINAPKANMEQLNKDCDEMIVAYMKARGLESQK